MLTDPKSLFYIYRPDFSYSKYIETRSHFDSVSIAIDHDFRRLIASNEDLAEQQIRVSSTIVDEISALHESTAAGIDILSFDLRDISKSVEDLNSLCEMAFAETISELQSMNKNLKRIQSLMEQLALISASRNQYQALEDYSYALKSVSRQMYRRALNDLDCAISGYNNFRGYPYDYRFYSLKGKIHLGQFENVESELIDLALARQAFLEAAVHADQEDPGACAAALALAAWCSYCTGDFDDAAVNYKKALQKDNNNGKIFLEYSRLLIQNNKYKTAKSYFIQAMRLNPFQQSILLDPIFANSKYVKHWTQELIDEQKNKLLQLAEYFKRIFETEILDLCQKYCPTSVPSIQTFSSFSDTSQIKEGQLPSLYRMHETYKHAKNELQHLVEPMLNTIRNENNKLISFYLKEYDKKRTEGSFSATKVMQIYAKRVLIFSLIVWITLYFLSSLDSLFLRSEYFFYAFGVGVLTATLLFTILIFVEYFLHLLNRPNLYKEMRDITEIISELRAEQIEVDHIFRLQKWFLTLRN